jgi:hypothetical protein
LPDEIKPEALESLMVGTLHVLNSDTESIWEAAVSTLFDSFYESLERCVLEIFNDANFQRWSGCPLPTKARDIILGVLGKAFEERKHFIKAAMRFETISGVVYCDKTKVNEEFRSLFDVLRDKHHKDLLSIRYEVRAKEIWKRQNLKEVERLEDEFTKKEEKARIDDKMKKDIAKADFQNKMPKDPYLREVEVIAKMKAYYQYSATRFVENVSMAIQKGLPDSLKTMERELRQGLYLESREG